jgi:release factor glutamine methyltransferase
VRQEPPRFLGKYDMIVSNPPYVTSEDMETLDPEVRDFEPHIALDGGPDGLEFYRAILQNYTPLLRPGGSICLEFGMGQEQDILRLLEQAGYTIGRLQRDTGERPRAVLAHRNDITTGEDE